MASRGQFRRANELLNIIKKHKKIHKFDLMDEARISISTYDKIKPWFEYKYRHSVRYDKKNQVWEWIAEDCEKEFDEDI